MIKKIKKNLTSLLKNPLFCVYSMYAEKIVSSPIMAQSKNLFYKTLIFMQVPHQQQQQQLMYLRRRAESAQTMRDAG